MLKFFFLLIVSLLGINILNANDAVLKKTIENEGGVNVKIIKSDNTNIKDLKIVILEQPNGIWLPVLASSDGKTIMGDPSILISSDDKFKDALQNAGLQAQKHNKDITDKNILAVFKQYPQNVVSLEGGDKTHTTYMIVDPNCPYCYQEIQKLDDTLKTSNVKMLVVGALGQDSVKKAASFYNELKNQKTQQDKISLIKKVFERNYKADPNVDISHMMDIGKSLSQAGLQAVPYIIKQ